MCSYQTQPARRLSKTRVSKATFVPLDTTMTMVMPLLWKDANYTSSPYYPTWLSYMIMLLCWSPMRIRSVLAFPARRSGIVRPTQVHRTISRKRFERTLCQNLIQCSCTTTFVSANNVATMSIKTFLILTITAPQVFATRPIPRSFNNRKEFRRTNLTVHL